MNRWRSRPLEGLGCRHAKQSSMEILFIKSLLPRSLASCRDRQKQQAVGGRAALSASEMLRLMGDGSEFAFTNAQGLELLLRCNQILYFCCGDLSPSWHAATRRHSKRKCHNIKFELQSVTHTQNIQPFNRWANFSHQTKISSKCWHGEVGTVKQLLQPGRNEVRIENMDIMWTYVVDFSILPEWWHCCTAQIVSLLIRDLHFCMQTGSNVNGTTDSTETWHQDSICLPVTSHKKSSHSGSSVSTSCCLNCKTASMRKHLHEKFLLNPDLPSLNKDFSGVQWRLSCQRQLWDLGISLLDISFAGVFTQVLAASPRSLVGWCHFLNDSLLVFGDEFDSSGCSDGWTSIYSNWIRFIRGVAAC